MMDIIECKSCKSKIGKEDFISNLNVCVQCSFHHYVSARDRINMTADEGTFREMAQDMESVDFLRFDDVKPYAQRLEEAKKSACLPEAIVIGSALIGGFGTTLAVMDFSFMGGSMGSVVGEKIKIAADHSIENKLPLIIFCASGGARMQEGIISLMQMAKTVSCINRLKESGGLYVSVITHPTTGGVSASFATVADIIIAEPKALFCFAGPRVVKQTIKKELPDDFGTAERNLRNGAIDMIKPRAELRDTLTTILSLFKNG
jgi:acetyl-CoA carboxylase carboxyl transferase subunit beta